jgi:hypothetical protein
VHKHVPATADGSDEAESLLPVVELDRTLRHIARLLRKAVAVTTDLNSLSPAKSTRAASNANRANGLLLSAESGLFPC